MTTTIPFCASLLASALLALPAFAADPAAPPVPPATQPASSDSLIRIAPFQDDKPAALSLTFDDGSENQIALGVPLLDKYHLKASFFVIAGLTREHASDPLPHNKDQWGEVSWDQWRTVAQKGYEIGNHSLTHIFLTKIPDDQLAREVNDSAALIAKEIGTPPISFVCPFNEMNDHVRDVVLQHHLCLRDQWIEFGGPAFTPDVATHAVDDAILTHRWLVPMLHGINHDGYDPLPPATLEQILAYIDKRRASLWIDTFGHIGCYLQERQHTQVALLQKTADTLKFRLDTTLDPARYNVPLTLILPRWWNKPAQLLLHSSGKPVPLLARELADRLLLTLPCATATYSLQVFPASIVRGQPVKTSTLTHAAEGVPPAPRAVP
jgi:peptidoglycan/xylan/chitin deacetylase (PgdA/CDA1 family)